MVLGEDEQRDIRSNVVEKQSAELLETLIKSFIGPLSTGDSQRSSKVFTIDVDALLYMECHVGDVQTWKLTSAP